MLLLGALMARLPAEDRGQLGPCLRRSCATSPQTPRPIPHFGPPRRFKLWSLCRLVASKRPNRSRYVPQLSCRLASACRTSASRRCPYQELQPLAARLYPSSEPWPCSGRSIRPFGPVAMHLVSVSGQEDRRHGVAGVHLKRAASRPEWRPKLTARTIAGVGIG